MASLLFFVILLIQLRFEQFYQKDNTIIEPEIGFRR